MEPWRELQPWQYKDWMGWHEQGDGKLFLGINIVQGRVKDFDTGVRVKSFLKEVVDALDLTMVLSPTQSIIFKDIFPQYKSYIQQLMMQYEIDEIQMVDPLVRLSMACPALPLCGLAVTEAERRMPEFMHKTRAVMSKLGMVMDEVTIRVTGCPNGCARPYMAELALVGDGPDMYQVCVYVFLCVYCNCAYYFIYMGKNMYLLSDAMIIV